MKYALDTNIISYFLKDDKIVASRIRANLNSGATLVIPHIVFFEIERWLRNVGARVKHAKFTQFVNDCAPLMSVAFEVWDVAADLYVSVRKAGLIIDDNDLVIAAFCIVNGCTLVTNNAKHFERIDGLEFVNWKE